jgi:predicted dehydrogenase
MYKIIVAGCGMVSDTWIQIALARGDCEIVGLVNRNIDRAKAKKTQFNLSANTYSSLANALEKENANLVFDLTAPESHFEITTTALKAGCHVFGEKPMSDTLENAEKMVQAAEESKREYFVMQNRRFVPGIVSMRDFLRTNRLGVIGQVSASFQLDPHFGGFREEMESPLIADMAIHTFDAARFITGKNPVSVYCHEYNPTWSWYKGNANAVCIFEMEDGSVFDYKGSWCANGMNTSWESEWRVACAHGAVFWDGHEKLYYDLTSTGPPKTGLASENEITADYTDIPIKPQPLNGHEICVTEMFDALKNGTHPQTDCRDNINSIRMVYKAIESARNKKLILL